MAKHKSGELRCPATALINDNDNCCISGVFGWDFNLILSKVFVACARQLNFIQFSFFMMSPREVVFGVVPGKNDELCPREGGLSSSCLSPVKTIIGVPGKMVYLHYTTVYCAYLSVVLVAFRSC